MLLLHRLQDEVAQETVLLSLLFRDFDSQLRLEFRLGWFERALAVAVMTAVASALVLASVLGEMLLPVTVVVVPMAWTANPVLHQGGAENLIRPSWRVDKSRAGI